ncbi:hypothetical protein C8R45DRAFT_1182808 [Mycena sanguinolenta]|nr:hypothetical protein C8R45DRAFT_1182808 [Mycena sanguinolenta]
MFIPARFQPGGSRALAHDGLESCSLSSVRGPCRLASANRYAPAPGRSRSMRRQMHPVPQRKYPSRVVIAGNFPLLPRPGQLRHVIFSAFVPSTPNPALLIVSDPHHTLPAPLLASRAVLLLPPGILRQSSSVLPHIPKFRMRHLCTTAVPSLCRSPQPGFLIPLLPSPRLCLRLRRARARLFVTSMPFFPVWDIPRFPV